VGFKPDGTPYQLTYVAAALFDPYWQVCYNVIVSGLERSGAEVTFFDPKFVLQDQIAIVEDLIHQHPDGLALYCIDSSGDVPVVEKAESAGIPVFTADIRADTEKLTFHCGYDQTMCGEREAEYINAEAERMGHPLVIYQIACPLVFEKCTEERNAFEEKVKEFPLLKLYLAPDIASNWGETAHMDLVMDALAAHPDINCIVHQGALYEGVRQALSVTGHLYPVWHPQHLAWYGRGESPSGCMAMRDGYLTGMFTNDAWAIADTVCKAVLDRVCLNKSIPNRIDLPFEAISRDTLDKAPWGETKRWGDMTVLQPDITQWPILDMSAVGIPTPQLEK
jgi:ribose transport system substrate-binding protein